MGQQLTKGMYGHQFERTSDLFGVRCGQVRGRYFIKNAGWYNKQGEKLGWGDLTTHELLRIWRELEDGEFFVILHEADSFWRFVTRPGLLGHNAAVKPDAEAPGVDYVAERTQYIVGKYQFYFVDHDGYRKGETEMNLNGLDFTILTTEDAKRLLAS